jgi:3-mercaptopyruvate sulfurtransferase SseA
VTTDADNGAVSFRNPQYIVDSLPASSLDGTDPGYGPRRGHITGAVNVSYSDLIESETAGFLPAVEMKAVLDSAHLLDE